MSYPNLNGQPERLKMKTKDDEIKEVEYKTGKHDYEKSLKSPKLDSDHYRKNFKGLNRKKLLLIVSEI